MLTDSWTDLRPHALQSLAWRTSHRFVGLACGRGSGKTELARRRIVRYLSVKKKWRNPIYFYALPTYSQAKRVAWGELKGLIPTDWISKVNKSDLAIETIFGSTLYVVGMDKPERVEGVQWDGCVIDESCDIKPGAFAKSVVPALEHRSGWCWRIGVPKRQGIGAEEFREFCEKGDEQGRNGILSLSWKSSDILTPKQIQWAMENLDPLDFEEQYEASWKDIGSSIFYAFNPSENVSDKVVHNKNMPITIGSDFNVDPMSWVIGHRYENELHIFDEVSIRNTNTPKTLDNLFGKYGHHENGFEFYGDASGRARKTSADITDYLHIKGDERFKGAQIFYPKANPPTASRFASCNAMFCNAKGVRRLYIHPRCTKLIRDLKYRSYKEGTREPDDHGDVGHMTDALGYIVHRRYPIRLKQLTPKVGVN